MGIDVTNKLRLLPISSTVWLWFNNEGFRFCMAGGKYEPEGLEDWNTWSDFWPLYKRDKIEQSVMEYLSACPDHCKDQTFYQAMIFKSN